MASGKVVLWAGACLWLGACSAGGPRSEFGEDAAAETSAGTADGANLPVGTTTSDVAGEPNAATAPSCPMGQQPNGFTGGPSTCCSGSYAVCDDFEDGAPGDDPNGSRWTVEKFSKTYGIQAGAPASTAAPDNAAIIEISNTMSARGKQSLHIRAQNSNQLPNNGWHHDMVVNRTLFPAPNNTFWGRAFVYYVSDTNSKLPGGHCTFADASGTVPASRPFYTWWRISTFGNFAVNCEHGDQSASNSTRMPLNRWACLEWLYKGDTNEVHLYLDGNQLAATTSTTSLTDNPNGYAPAYDTFRLGFETYSYQYNPTPTYFEMYYDEVVLDYARIGCAN